MANRIEQLAREMLRGSVMYQFGRIANGESAVAVADTLVDMMWKAGIRSVEERDASVGHRLEDRRVLQQALSQLLDALAGRMRTEREDRQGDTDFCPVCRRGTIRHPTRRETIREMNHADRCALAEAWGVLEGSIEICDERPTETIARTVEDVWTCSNCGQAERAKLTRCSICGHERSNRA